MEKNDFIYAVVKFNSILISIFDSKTQFRSNPTMRKNRNPKKNRVSLNRVHTKMQARDRLLKKVKNSYGEASAVLKYIKNLSLYTSEEASST